MKTFLRSRDWHRRQSESELSLPKLSASLLLAFLALAGVTTSRAQIPGNYRGKPFADAFHKSGPPNIPGIIPCALYDLGGEGVAYRIKALYGFQANIVNFRYAKGNNFAYFEFEPVDPSPLVTP